MRNYDYFLTRFFDMAGEPSAPLRRGARGTGSWKPAVDIYEGDEAIIVVVELPGVPREGIVVEAEGNTLRISGVRRKAVPAGTSHVHQMEIPYGPFSRTIQMPPYADVHETNARHEDGFLTVTVPRKGAV